VVSSVFDGSEDPLEELPLGVVELFATEDVSAPFPGVDWEYIGTKGVFDGEADPWSVPTHEKPKRFFRALFMYY